MSSFKDLFSVQASNYAKYRPNYSEELFKYLSSLTEQHKLAWDVGCGNGQASVELAKFYKLVAATDPSAKQIEAGIPKNNIQYTVGSAESSHLNNQSVDLITVAQAFHWFKQPQFFAEVQRVTKPKAVLAIWCYELAQVNAEVDAKVMELYEGVLGSYWEKERKLVEEGYRNEKIPFDEIKAPQFKLHADWSLDHLVGYFSTWSALQTYIKKNGVNPLENFYPELKKIWGSDAAKPITWNLSLRVFRV